MMRDKGELKVILVVDKEAFKETIYIRLQSGLTFLSQEINTKQEQKEWWDAFIDWDIYNVELIKQAFDRPDNSYVEEYKRSTGGGGIYFSGTYKPPTLKESIESARDEMKFQVRKLKWFYEKIDLLKTSENLVKSDNMKHKFDLLITLLSRFHKVAQELRDRRQGKETLIIKDEYDVQDLLNALLNLHFDDIRKEDFSPSNAGGNSRLDFVLKKEKIIIEVKMSSDRLKAKELGEELLIDIGRYKEYPDCKDLVIFIYDKGDHIRNKKGLITDLEKQSTNDWKITVVISPN